LIISISLINFKESVVCIPPSVPAKDNQGVECCRLPSEIFPHKVIYEEFCNTVYFGVMADGPNGRFCRLSGIQLRRTFFIIHFHFIFLSLSYQLISDLDNAII
uniref:BPTI/Kunitz inhibitor domain-containing protein n=1 Tax=Brugia pahangi TaxID=6280 RepID=A0A0N4TRS4_BRUPA